jgi:hypothetical protein
MPRLRHVARMQDQATRQHFHQTSTPSMVASEPARTTVLSETGPFSSMCFSTGAGPHP